MSSLFYISVKESDLKCMKCLKFLKHSIISSDIGNFCGECFNIDLEQGGTRNIFLEKLLKSIQITCKYKKKGCNEKVNWNNTSEHEQVCFFRDFQCPITAVSCSWAGNLKEIKQHIIDEHPKFYLKKNIPTLDLNVNIDQDISSNYLLESQHEAFVIIAKLEKGKFYLKIFDAETDNELTEYSITLWTKEKLVFVGKYKIQTFFIMNTYTLNENDLIIDINTFKSIFNNTFFTITCKISGEINYSIKLDEDILSHFECPVCNEYMKDNIRICSTGHNICNKCVDKVSSCPICRGNFFDARNYTLEAMRLKVDFPCTNRDYGCNVVLPVSSLMKHECNCKFRRFKCFICNWTGEVQELTRHVKTHGIEKTFTREFSVNNAENFKTALINCHDEIFLICYKIISNSNAFTHISFYCKVLGMRNKNKFKYIVRLDTKKESLVLEKVGICNIYDLNVNSASVWVIFPVILLQERSTFVADIKIERA